MPMPLDKLMEQVIVRGLESVERYETNPARKRGCLAGFGLCRGVLNLEQLEAIIAQREDHEEELRLRQVSPDEYWEYRVATAQVQHYYEVLKVVFNRLGLFYGPLYYSKIRLYQDIIDEYEKQRVF